MQTKDGFILFDNFLEFMGWLDEQKITGKKLIQNHHTLIPRYVQFKNNHFAQLAGMKKSHMVDRGFSDIAQHFTTFPDGKIATGRPLEKDPAGIKGANPGAICIEHLGNFNLNGDQMTEKHKGAIVQLNAALCDKFNLPIDTNHIVYHAWYNRDTGVRDNEDGTKSTAGNIQYKTCPGTGFFGGHSVEAANRYFIPVVKAALKS